MKRPFYFVKDRHTGKAINRTMYDDKMEAKKDRNRRNPPRGEDFVEGTPERYYIGKVVM